MENDKTPQLNPWKSIWTSPRKTLHYLLSTNPKRAVLALSIIGGALSAVAWYVMGTVKGANEPLFKASLTLFIFLLIVGAIMGIIHLYLMGWLYRLTGGWLKGKGSSLQVRCAIGWSQYPLACASLLAIFAALAHAHPLLQIVFNLGNLVLTIWGLIIFFQLLGEAHQFSAWRALGAVLIAAVLILVVLTLIALIIPLITPLFSP